MRYQAALRPECCTNTADKTKFKGYNSYKIQIFLVFNAIKDFMIKDSIKGKIGTFSIKDGKKVRVAKNSGELIDG